VRIIDARSRPPIEAFLGDRTYSSNLFGTVANVRARGWDPPASLEHRSLDLFWAETAEAGIDLACLPARVPNRWWGGAGNDPVFAACEDEDRFLAYAALNPYDDPGAADAVAGLKERGAIGIVVEPGIADEPAYVDDPRIDPLCEACLGADLPLLIMAGGEAGPDLSYCDPVLLDRLAIRHPELQIVNVHGGWPYVQEALGVAFRRKNVWYLGDVYFPNLPGEADIVLAMRTFLQDRFLFSTGYPFCPLNDIVDRYLGFGLPDDVLENVMGGNAARLFGI
jgi:predicted TIM-barrel fold metal-dependent hydrolase